MEPDARPEPPSLVVVALDAALERAGTIQPIATVDLVPAVEIVPTVEALPAVVVEIASMASEDGWDADAGATVAVAFAVEPAMAEGSAPVRDRHRGV